MSIISFKLICNVNSENSEYLFKLVKKFPEFANFLNIL